MISDAALVLRSRGGDELATRQLVGRYGGLIRFEARPYFIVGGDDDDLIQEGLFGLYKAIRDYRSDRESGFRNFAELCITRQIISGVKMASRAKHSPLNAYVPFSIPPTSVRGDTRRTLEETLSGNEAVDPLLSLTAEEDLAEFVAAFDCLTPLERDVAVGFLDGGSYVEVADRLDLSFKTVDNAKQRIRRKFDRLLAEAA
jgi:RNA polymerase sporulation-specific sigma factor